MSHIQDLKYEVTDQFIEGISALSQKIIVETDLKWLARFEKREEPYLLKFWDLFADMMWKHFECTRSHFDVRAVVLSLQQALNEPLINTKASPIAERGLHLITVNTDNKIKTLIHELKQKVQTKTTAETWKWYPTGNVEGHNSAAEEKQPNGYA